MLSMWCNISLLRDFPKKKKEDKKGREKKKTSKERMTKGITKRTLCLPLGVIRIPPVS